MKLAPPTAEMRKNCLRVIFLVCIASPPVMKTKLPDASSDERPDSFRLLRTDTNGRETTVPRLLLLNRMALAVRQRTGLGLDHLVYSSVAITSFSLSHCMLT